MNATTDPPRRRPGGGRKPGYSEPVTVVSISMHPEQLRAIDREAFQSNRSRSGFVRWILRDACHKLQSGREDRPASYNDDYVLEDPTHGGRFDPSLIGAGTWSCATCSAEDPTLNAKVVSGWLNCPGCKTPRGDAAIVPYPVED